MPGQVLAQVVEAEDDIAEVALAVGHVQFGDDGAIVGDLGHQAVGVG